MVKKRMSDGVPPSVNAAPAGKLMGKKSRGASLPRMPVPLAVAAVLPTSPFRIDLGARGETLSVGKIYLNAVSDLFVFEIGNTSARKLRVQLRAELRKPFHGSRCRFQLESDNENLRLLEEETQDSSSGAADARAGEELGHVPVSVVRPSARAMLCAERVYLSQGYNELFNEMATIDHVGLEPYESKKIVLSMCIQFPQTLGEDEGDEAARDGGDSSEEERSHLNESSCLPLNGRIVFAAAYTGEDAEAHTVSHDTIVPMQGQVCRSLLRLDVKELHFDDCIPDGSFVKDFTVWNRSEIPLLFQIVSPVSLFKDTRELLTFADYNSGYALEGKIMQAAAYGHVRIRVTYRPLEVGEQFYEVHIQNMHDARNSKTLKIHAITNKEHHREGLSIREPSGSYLMSGSRLDFGDCYTGLATSKTLTIKNATGALLNVELGSDRPKEVAFELKLQPNRARASPSTQGEDTISSINEPIEISTDHEPESPTGDTDGYSQYTSLTGYGGDSEDEADDNEAEFATEEDPTANNQRSFEETALGDVDDDADDDFEFDGDPQAHTRNQMIKSDEMNITGETSYQLLQEDRTLRSRVPDINFENDIASASSSSELKSRRSRRSHPSIVIDDIAGSNFLVETIELPPGGERTILIWYTPAMLGSSDWNDSDHVDGKVCRLTKQSFRVSFRCFQSHGAFQQGQARVYDRALGKSIHIRARTCSAIVTVIPSILHLGDCNIGELKSSSCMITNHSELPTVIKPLVTSKVISTVPNDDMMLGPKQSIELRVEIIPRKINPNYSRMISIVNMRNKANLPQVCVRSSNMDAHHVIYHSLFYKLVTPSRSAFLNFDHVAVNSMGVQVFDLENITSAPLQLGVRSSDPARVRLFCFRAQNSNPFAENKVEVASLSGTPNASPSMQFLLRQNGRVIRRRRSIGCIEELRPPQNPRKKNTASIIRGYLARRAPFAAKPGPGGNVTEISRPRIGGGSGTTTPLLVESQAADPNLSIRQISTSSSLNQATSTALSELTSLIDIFDSTRMECDRYCHSSVESVEKEREIVNGVRERTRLFQRLLGEKKLVPISLSTERNIRLAAKSRQRIVVVFSPAPEQDTQEPDKMKMEKYKIAITLPPGGNMKASSDVTRSESKAQTPWTTMTHGFDMRPSIRELIVKSRVSCSLMNVNQKNINFGRITVSSRSSKKLIVHNSSAIPLIFSVEKTGSISSGFLEIKEGDVGVVRPFGTKEICFEFQPTLAGHFEEKLKIVNVQDVENVVYVTIKAKVVKRENFKLLQSGEVLSFGKCLVGEKSDNVKILVRNTSRKRREYVIELDPSFSNPALKPSINFSIDDAPSTIITQAQERKLDEELEKLEHKLRIATTKKKSDKIDKLNAKISRVKSLLRGEQVQDDDADANADSQPHATSATDSSGDMLENYNSESDFSETEGSSTRRERRKSKSPTPSSKPLMSVVMQNVNTVTFSLEAEATGRIVAHAIFRPGSNRESGDGIPHVNSQKAKKRQLRKESTPLVGVGTLLIFELQNKDVVKELQYNAEIFVRTSAGEAAYYRAVGKTPLPPFPHATIPRRPVTPDRPIDEAATVNRNAETPRLSPFKPDIFPSRPVSTRQDKQSQLQVVEDESEAKRLAQDSLRLKVEPTHMGMFRGSTLLVPIEDSPSNSFGWVLLLSHGLPNKSVLADVFWHPASDFQGLLTLSCIVSPPESVCTSPTNITVQSTGSSGLLTRVRIMPKQAVSLHVRWGYTQGSGFGMGTSVASCVGSSRMEAISKVAQLAAGRVDFNEVSELALPASQEQELARNSVVVALVKAIARSLQLERESIDLEKLEQDSVVKGNFVVHNRSRNEVKFLLLASSVRDSESGGVVPNSTPGGEFTFDSSTGRLDAESTTVVSFTYRAQVAGHHTEHIVIRNINDRMDTATLTVRVHVTRPVYIRIPELDPHATGRLEVLDLGACYVSPDMQDTNLDNPTALHKFSKVHKLSLKSQVDETLILSASSNLKNQCYVFEDPDLCREASNVIVPGNSNLELFVAVRPRLPPEAFKTGLAKDLVGGIRIQLFPVVETSPELTGGKGDMAAEFTITFVGLVGASLARVTPQLIDFGTQSRETACGHVYKGEFELVNLSKALMLKYRLTVDSDPTGFCDDDNGLQVTLKRLHGEIGPGETGQIWFEVVATGSGLFRQRILVENIHYFGKIYVVQLVIFVDNGLLRWSIPECDNDRQIIGLRAIENGCADLGIVPVIALENALTEQQMFSDGDTENQVKRYRIFSERTSLPHGGLSSLPLRDRCVLLENMSENDILMRPISSLPLWFSWGRVDDNVAPPCIWNHSYSTALAATPTAIRRRAVNTSLELIRDAANVFYGDEFRVAQRSSCLLFFRFAPISITPSLQTSLVSNGKTAPLNGMIGIQYVDPSHDSADDAAVMTTSKMMSLTGAYGESCIQAKEASISLGKIGNLLGWHSSSFSVTIKNVSEMPAFFGLGTMPRYLKIKNVCMADLVKLGPVDNEEECCNIPTLRTLALRAYANHEGDPFTGAALHLEPLASCTIDMAFIQTSQHLTAGQHDFTLQCFNLYNPHNTASISVSAQVVSMYAEVVVDPESTEGSIDNTPNSSRQIAVIPPVTVPPAPEGDLHGPSFWFSIKNVYDEELHVTMSSMPEPQLERTLSFALVSRSANAPLSKLLVGPGESADVRVVCHVNESSRISSTFFPSIDNINSGNLIDLGKVCLDVMAQTTVGAAQQQEISVKGKIMPGRTFMISSSSLRFQAVALQVPADMPSDHLPSALKPKNINREYNQSGTPLNDVSRPQLYYLKTMSESFVLKNPSTTQHLNFEIGQVGLHYAGLCVVKGTTIADMCAMNEYIQAVAHPSSGSLPPGGSLKILVKLEESAPCFSDDNDSLLRSEDDNAKELALLHKARHHPSWRSNSWGSDGSKLAAEARAQTRMILLVRDVDASIETGLTADVDVQLVLQSAENESAVSVLDSTLLAAAFVTREKRLLTPKAPALPPSKASIRIETNLPAESSEDFSFEEFDVTSLPSEVTQPKFQLPQLNVRGCTPVDNSILNGTRYVIDVGQHTVRSGGEVEWEITIESLFGPSSNSDTISAIDTVEFRLLLVDQSANSWLQLNRDRGTLDRSRSYQSLVLFFYRDVVGLYSTFLVLQNLSNPGDLKVIQIKLEVVADLNSLRSMTSGVDSTTNLFRVVVFGHADRRKLADSELAGLPSTSRNESKLVVDYGDVYYNKPYHNHSIVLENSSSIALDFMLSSNARPNEVCFSVSPMSLSEVSTVTLAAYGRVQVFLHFRPSPKAAEVDGVGDLWRRSIEVYVNCRLVKDFRETVLLRAVCRHPQLAVFTASNKNDKLSSNVEATIDSHGYPSLLGVAFSMGEGSVDQSEQSVGGKFVVVRNTRADVGARIAMRNDSMFFKVEVDDESLSNSGITVRSLEKGVCAGRRSTVLVTLAPLCKVLLRVTVDISLLKKFRETWDRGLREHITVYNMKQFAEHYQIPLFFSCSNAASYYIPPNVLESFQFSALEDTIAKFLQNYHSTWNWLMTYFSKQAVDVPSLSLPTATSRVSPWASLSTKHILTVLSIIEHSLEPSVLLSPRQASPLPTTFASNATDDDMGADLARVLLQSYRALFFDFYYITDELIWYGIRGTAVRHSLRLADLAYGIVFRHELFRPFLTEGPSGTERSRRPALPRLLLPWARQLRHFLSYFPENQEATLPLRQLQSNLLRFEDDMDRDKDEDPDLLQDQQRAGPSGGDGSASSTSLLV